jgi:protein-disulfide isomerase
MRFAIPVAAFLIAWPAAAQDQRPQEQKAKDARGKPATAASANSVMTRDQGDAMLEELRQIKALLEKLQVKPGAPGAAAQAAPAEEFRKASLELDESFSWIGKNDAPITVVEFTDYECPYCRQFHISTFQTLRKNYVDPGKVRFVTVDLPLDIHSNSHKAALAARCAGDQGQFWSMRESLISNGNRLAGDTIPDLARGLYLDMPVFQGCLDGAKYSGAIDKTEKLSQSLGITGTPTFLIGKTTASGVDGFIVVGAMPYTDFETQLKKVDVN